MDITIECAQREVLRFAAAELIAYLSRMLPSDAGRFSAKLITEPTVPSANDAFSVCMTSAGGTITGNSDRAVLLGVYDCLHALGCRFLAPGQSNEVVPEIQASDIRLNYKKTAALRHRGVCIEGADSRENILDFIDWLPKLGYNAFFLQFKNPYAFLSRWYGHENNPTLSPEPFTVANAERVMAEAEAEMHRRGLMLHKVGHGWTGEVLGYEALSWNQDPRPLAEDKRPLAAQVNGVRDLFMGVPANTNLCLSNPDAIDRFAALVVRYAEENPNTDYLHIWLADAFNNVCECGACRETTVSDQYVALLNEIDRRLTVEGLDTKLVFLLYQELLWPPVTARLENPDRFVLMFAPISRTFERSYDTAGVSVSVPPFARNHITLPADLRENLAFLRGWQDVFSRDSFVYDYPLGRAHYGDLGYVHMARIIHGDIRCLEQLGLNGYISCQELRAGLPNFLPNYVMGRTLFDRNADIEELIGEYFSAAYGDRAAIAFDFLAELSRLGSCDYINGKGNRIDSAFATRMDEAAALCKRFLENTPEPESDGFWTRLRYHAQYVQRFATALSFLAKDDSQAAQSAWREMRQFICRHEEEYQPWLDVYRILEITKKYTGF